MIDARIKSVIVFHNGNVAVCDEQGHQMPEHQGSSIKDPGLITRVAAACGPDVEWLGPRPPAAGDARAVLLAWARADRDADDRAALLAGVERMVAAADRPVPGELIAARDRAQIALTEACKTEERAEVLLKETARRLLDDPAAPVLPEIRLAPTKDELYIAIKRALALTTNQRITRRALGDQAAGELGDAVDELAREAAQAVVILFPRN